MRIGQYFRDGIEYYCNSACSCLCDFLSASANSILVELALILGGVELNPGPGCLKTEKITVRSKCFSCPTIFNVSRIKLSCFIRGQL